MSGATLVAKRKAGRPRRLAVSKNEDLAQVRLVCSPAFKDWLERYAASRQLTMTDTIVQDLMRGAKDVGFEPPPAR